MPRKALGPRLYLDPKRRQWMIRDLNSCIRTGKREDDRGAAEVALAEYLAKGRAEAADGLIYFLTAVHPNYPVKIGYTKTFAALRIRGLQNACPFALYFIGHTTGTMYKEREYHTMFDRTRLRGEWFQRTPELLAFIEQVCPNITKIAS